MSLLTAVTIRKLIEEENLITKPSYDSAEEWDGRVGFIEGSQFDLTLDKVYIPILRRFTPFVGKYSRETPQLEEINTAYNMHRKEDTWNLPAGYYVCVTGETVSLPFWMKGLLSARSSYFMCGAVPEVTFVNPGFSGILRFGLTLHNHMEIGKGARIITLNLLPFMRMTVEGEDAVAPMILREEREAEIEPYTGVWGGKKISTDGIERPH